jgi:peptidoglycan/xylan/chitin deacetylase (PgdA/CDA1 family)
MNNIISNKVNILLYHQIGKSPNKFTNLDCFCDSKVFYSQLEFLKNSDYNVVSLETALDIVFGEKEIDANYVVLTFDDGCEKFYNTAFPILDEFGFASAIYPVSGYLGKQATWGNLKNPDLKILSKSMLKELCDLGVEIGAHTVDHVKLTKTARNNAIEQVKQSKDILEEITGKPINSFAYPHGDFNSEVIDIVIESGFSNALTCVNNSAEFAKSPFEIPRKYITYSDNLEQFKQKI